MVRYTDRVPYVGLVEWDNARIEDYARELLAEHHAQHGWWPFTHKHCAFCGTTWPCYAWMWASGTVRDE
jgi:hypothetical protein